MNVTKVDFNKQTFIPVPTLKEKDSLQSRTLKTTTTIFDGFARFWVYGGKSFIIVRHLLNASLQSCRMVFLSCHYFNVSLSKTITKLKLLAVVSIPLNIVTVPGQVSKVIKSVRLQDLEGIILSGLGLSLLTTDIVDSSTSFINAVRSVSGQAAIGWLSTFSMPLTFSMIAQGSVSRGVRWRNLNSFSGQLQQQLISHLKDHDKSPEEIRLILKSFLESAIGKKDVEAHLKELQLAILERHTNNKVATLLQGLAQWMQGKENFSSDDMDHLSKILEDIVDSLKKDTTIQQINLTANFLNLSAMLSFFTPIPVVIPFLVLAVGFSLRIIGQGYQDFT